MGDWVEMTEFTAVRDVSPDGFQILERLVEPCLVLARHDGTFSAQLYGQRSVRGQKKLYKAPGRLHNWVLDGTSIWPLPHDTQSLVANTLGDLDPECLSFAQIIALLRSHDTEALSIEADDSIFIAAQVLSDQLNNQLSVPGLEATLYPYQARGVRWMLDTIEHTGGLVLADEMGLGKTIQIIGLLLHHKPSNKSPALILCPTTLIANWRSEILRFAPELSLMIHRGSRRTGVSSGLQQSQIVITTYDTLVNDQSLFQSLCWSWVICDEAQALKNPDSGRHEAVAELRRTRMIPMTGTPVETSLMNLWALVNLSIPGLLGTRDEFEQSFHDDSESADQLATLTSPIVLRRKIADVAGDLPERIDVDIPLELTPAMADRYQSVLQESIERYPIAGALVATGQLALFCAHPWLQGRADSPDDPKDISLSTGKDGMPLITPKIERTISLVKEAFANHRKVLIFAIFNDCGKLIQQAMHEMQEDLSGVFWDNIIGSTAQENRQVIVDSFSAHDGPACLVLNPKAAGAGLNITAATMVIHYTQAWNPALEAQASARAHRGGQKNPVHVYRLFYENTVERVMIDRSTWRRELGNDAVPVSSRDKTDLQRALEIAPKSIGNDDE